MVPLVVTVPPLRPVPAVTEVTVPVVRDDTVIVPVLPLSEIPGPAAKLVTPALVMVTLPVGPETLIPTPGRMERTLPAPPVELSVEVV
jgi:hypothetical protein